MAVYMGYVNSQMAPEETKTLKSEPSDIVKQICIGIENGDDRIYPDKVTNEFIKHNPIKTIFFE